MSETEDAFAASFGSTKEDEDRRDAERALAKLEQQIGEVRDWARETAQSLAARGSEVHLVSAAHSTFVGPIIEEFEREGWSLSHMTSHFRDFGNETILPAAILIKGKPKGWMGMLVGDLYSLLFRRAAE